MQMPVHERKVTARQHISGKTVVQRRSHMGGKNGVSTMPSSTGDRWRVGQVMQLIIIQILAPGSAFVIPNQPVSSFLSLLDQLVRKMNNKRDRRNR